MGLGLAEGRTCLLLSTGVEDRRPDSKTRKTAPVSCRESRRFPIDPLVEFAHTPPPECVSSSMKVSHGKWRPPR